MRGRHDDEFIFSARLTWAKLIHRVYEVDPLLCPFFGAEMRVLGFILDFGTARAIRKSLKLPAQEPEPTGKRALRESANRYASRLLQCQRQTQ